MSSYHDTVICLAIQILANHKVRGLGHAGGFNASDFNNAIRIREIDAVIADFEAIHARVDLVANAVAAHALDEMGIKHAIPASGLRLQVRTPRPVPKPRHYPMSMCWGRR